MNEYMQIYLSSPFADQPVDSLFTLFFLALARIAPIILFSPFFGARILPHPVKVGFAITLFSIFFPMLINITTPPLIFNYFSYFLFLKEIIVGLLIGLFVSIPFHVVESAGMLIDHQRGGASLMVNDPILQNQSSPIGTFYNQILIFLFFFIDGPFYVLDALAYSYEMIPPDQFLSRKFFNMGVPYWDQAMAILNIVMVTAIKLASPSLIIILMTDSFLGIINRLAPQVMITFLGMPLKSLLGIAIIAAGWKLLVKQMTVEAMAWVEKMKELVFYLSINIPPASS